MNNFFIASILILGLGLINCGEKTPPGNVFIISPQHGEEVKSPVTFKMGVEGLEVSPAGAAVPGKGHHHIIINGDSIPSGEPVPFIEKKTYHFGKGQTEASIELEPGEYDISLQFANGLHISYGPSFSTKIRIKVVP